LDTDEYVNISYDYGNVDEDEAEERNHSERLEEVLNWIIELGKT
jgi:hypothetical protein